MDHANGQPTFSVTDLGGPIGLGRTAEVFARGDDEAVKLLRPGIPEIVGEREASVAALVDGAGVGAPRFGGTTRIDGRLGLVYERLDGPSMLGRFSRNPLEVDRLARAFAELHVAMHDADGSGLLDQKAEMRRMIDRAGDRLPDGARAAALARLDALPAGRTICHGDMHPGNVLMTSGGPVVIDWMTSSCGDPAGDVARTLFLLRHSGIPRYMPRIQRNLIALARRRFVSIYLRRYHDLRTLDQIDVDAWRLPVLAARLGEGIEEERPAVLALLAGEMS